MIRILVIDDEEEICSLTKSFLTKRNYQVFTANNAAEAINALKTEHPQLVLLDVRLGSVSGMDVLKTIKEIDSNVKVIMVTALNDDENIKEAMSLGANDYITKPFTAAYLNDLLAQKLADLGGGSK